MTDSISSLNEQTKVANLDEAKEAIQSIEAQLLELKSCIRSIEAVEAPPQFTPEQLRALARKFFVMGAEAMQEDSGYRETEFSGIEFEGDGDGLSWSFRGDVTIGRHELEYADPISWAEPVIPDDEIDEVIGQTQAEQ